MSKNVFESFKYFIIICLSRVYHSRSHRRPYSY